MVRVRPPFVDPVFWLICYPVRRESGG
jgi:hypothetical protein